MNTNGKSMFVIRLELELNPSGVYTVTSPDVPGLVTEGSTPEEISHNVQEVLAGLFEVWSALGMEIPVAIRQKKIALTQSCEMLVAA